MKKVSSVLLSAILFGCSYNDVAPAKPVITAKRIATEEYLVRDYSDPSANIYEKSTKSEFIYNQDKLVQITSYDYDPVLHSYTSGYKSDEFHYDGSGRLSQWISFMGNGGQWVKEYDYSVTGETKVSRSEQWPGTNKILSDWWIVTEASLSLNIKYYQGSNQLYSEIRCELDGNGNVTSIDRTPSLPVGKVYYKYDDAPNPYYFPELGDDVFRVNTYFSKNNYVEVNSDASTHAAVLITYDKDKYPTEIRSDSYKKVISYNR
ncbi:hypothetical protein WSM22_38710 [Cytophagales bacterium WSM2-2]|nr:hypothetical protein WSM22_38710 [Cytophagales bacterium WSM2-2]